MNSLWEYFLEFKLELESLIATGQWLKNRERPKEYDIRHSQAYTFESYISSSNELLEEINSQCKSNKKNREEEHVKSIEYLREKICSMPIREILTPPDDSNLNSRLLKLKELSDRLELLKIARESNEEFSLRHMLMDVACENFQNRVQETISLIECELNGHLNSDLSAEWCDPYACNVYNRVEFNLENIEDGEEHDSYVYRYILLTNRMTNYDRGPFGIPNLRMCISNKEFKFGRYLTAKSSNIMKSGITEFSLLMFSKKAEITSVHYLKSLLIYDEEQLLNNEEKLYKVIGKFLTEFHEIRKKEKCISSHDIEYIFYFIELFIRVVNYVAGFSHTEDNFSEWFEELQVEAKELLKIVNLIKFSELTIPETINLHVIARIVKLLSIMIKNRQNYIRKGLTDKDYFENCNKLLVKIAWQLYKDERSTKQLQDSQIKFKEFFIDYDTKVEFKSEKIKIKDQAMINVDNILEKSSSKWSEKLQSVDIENKSCILCRKTNSEHTDLVLFLKCNDVVICFKCVNFWFTYLDTYGRDYRCIYCSAEVDRYVRLSRLNEIREEL